MKKIRQFERFINRLPIDWIIGIMLGILVAAWAVYKLAAVAGG